MAPNDEIPCAKKGCEATIKNHRWGRTKSDWFEQKDGRVWCPEHTPAWVEEWRKQREKRHA